MDKKLLSMYNSRLYRAHDTEYGALVNKTLQNAGFTLTKSNLISSKSFSGLDDGEVDKLFDKLYTILPKKKADLLAKYNLDDSFINLLTEYYDFTMEDGVRVIPDRGKTTSFTEAMTAREKENGKTALQIDLEWNRQPKDGSEGGILNKLGKKYREGTLTIEEVNEELRKMKEQKGEAL